MNELRDFNVSPTTVESDHKKLSFSVRIGQKQLNITGEKRLKVRYRKENPSVNIYTSLKK